MFCRVYFLCFVIALSAFGCKPKPAAEKQELERMLQGLEIDRNPLTRPIDSLLQSRYAFEPSVIELSQKPIWEGYVAISAALARNDSTQAARLADALGKRSFDVEAYKGASEQLNWLRSCVGTVKQYSDAAWGGRTLADQRAMFESLSSPVFGLLQYAGTRGERVHRYYSRTALSNKGAFWMQSSESPILDPYAPTAADSTRRLTEVIQITTALIKKK